jgi:hypothetical protein
MSATDRTNALINVSAPNQISDAFWPLTITSQTALTANTLVAATITNVGPPTYKFPTNMLSNFSPSQPACGIIAGAVQVPLPGARVKIFIQPTVGYSNALIPLAPAGTSFGFMNVVLIVLDSDGATLITSTTNTVPIINFNNTALQASTIVLECTIPYLSSRPFFFLRIEVNPNTTTNTSFIHYNDWGGTYLVIN